MERVPPKLPNTSSRLIAMAASLMGEAQAVRAEMKCSEDDFRAYCAGEREPPLEQLDRVITVIIREQGKLIAKNREFLARMRDKDKGGRKS